MGDTVIDRVALEEREKVTQWFRGMLIGCGMNSHLIYDNPVTGEVVDANRNYGELDDEQLVRYAHSAYQGRISVPWISEEEAIAFLEGFFDGAMLGRGWAK